MNKAKIEIWGREFELDVSFYVAKGKDVTDSQKNALDLFLKADASKLIESAKSEVEEYCFDNANDNEIDEPITNIFKYVIPKSIFVDKVRDDSRIVALMCNFKFDMEHGLAVIFKNEKFDEVGEQGLVF